MCRVLSLPETNVGSLTLKAIPEHETLKSSQDFFFNAQETAWSTKIYVFLIKCPRVWRKSNGTLAEFCQTKKNNKNNFFGPIFQFPKHISLKWCRHFCFKEVLIASLLKDCMLPPVEAGVETVSVSKTLLEKSVRSSHWDQAGIATSHHTMDGSQINWLRNWQISVSPASQVKLNL